MKKVKSKVQPNKIRGGADKKTAPASQKKTGFYIGTILLILFTLYSFFPAIHNGFTNWDDPNLITDNPIIKKISAENIKRIFTEVYFANYQPLHMLSYMLEYKFFGLNGAGYHWVSIIMHLINVLLVGYLARLVSKNNFIAFFTALFFAVTPMRVESVAWAAERKDLLYSMFFFAAMIFYTYYLERKYKLKFLIVAFLFFVLSVFSKAMAVSLIPVLFLMDFYFNRKFNWRLIVEKIPFLILAVVMGAISAIASKEAGSMETDDSGLGMLERIFFACNNMVNYVGKLIYPYGLTAYYQYPDPADAHSIKYYISAIIILAAAVLIVLSVRKNKFLFFSAGYFVTTIALVLMIIPVGPTVFSERYSYVPSVMLYFLLIFYLYKWIENKNSVTAKNVAAALMIGYAFFFAQVSRVRCEVWKDSISLWTDVIKTNPRIPQAYNNRGHAYSALHDSQKALADFRQAIAFRSNFEKPYASISNIYREEGRYDSALYYANKALELKADMPQALVNRGIVYAIENNTQAAMEDFNKAIRLQPEMFEAYNNRGNLYCMLGKLDSGLVDYNHSIQINPDFTEPYLNKGRLFKNQNKFDEAIKSFNIYFSKKGTSPDAYLMMAECYAGKKDFTTAIQWAQQAKSLGAAGADKLIENLQIISK